MTPKIDRRQLILCSRCETHVGDVTEADTLRRRRRDGWELFVPQTPYAGEVAVWCDGCDFEGFVNVPRMFQQSTGRQPIRARLRRVNA